MRERPLPSVSIVRTSSAFEQALRPGSGVHVQFCSHRMHPSCAQRYRMSLLAKALNGTLHEGMQCIDVEKFEFLCPMCKSLSNIVVPYVEATWDDADTATPGLDSGIALAASTLLDASTSVISERPAAAAAAASATSSAAPAGDGTVDAGEVAGEAAAAPNHDSAEHHVREAHLTANDLLLRLTAGDVSSTPWRLAVAKWGALAYTVATAGGTAQRSDDMVDMVEQLSVLGVRNMAGVVNLLHSCRTDLTTEQVLRGRCCCSFGVARARCG